MGRLAGLENSHKRAAQWIFFFKYACVTDKGERGERGERYSGLFDNYNNFIPGTGLTFSMLALPTGLARLHLTRP